MRAVGMENGHLVCDQHVGPQHPRQVARHILRQKAVSSQMVGNDSEVKFLSHPTIEKQILAALRACRVKLAVESIDGLQRFPTDKYRAAVTYKIPREDVVENIACAIDRSRFAELTAVGVDTHVPAVCKASLFSSRNQGLKLTLDLGGRPKIIGINESDEIGVSALPPAISRGRDSRMVLPDDPDPGILINVSLCDHGGVVGRAVIHDDDLEQLM